MRGRQATCVLSWRYLKYHAKQEHWLASLSDHELVRLKEAMCARESGIAMADRLEDETAGNAASQRQYSGNGNSFKDVKGHELEGDEPRRAEEEEGEEEEEEEEEGKGWKPLRAGELEESQVNTTEHHAQVELEAQLSLEHLKRRTPSGWRVYMSRSKGRPYWAHKDSKIRSWTLPDHEPCLAHGGGRVLPGESTDGEEEAIGRGAISAGKGGHASSRTRAC